MNEKTEPIDQATELRRLMAERERERAEVLPNLPSYLAGDVLETHEMPAGFFGEPRRTA